MSRCGLAATALLGHLCNGAVTGYGQEKDRVRTLAAGFDHHLVKPVDTKNLISLLAEISKV